MGFTTRVAENKSGATNRSPGLEKSIGFQKYKIRGNFEADLLFHKFPFDMQELQMEVVMPDLPLRKAQFVARADRVTSSPGAGDLPLWETKCIFATVDTVDERDKGYSFRDAQDDPFSMYIQKLEDLEPSLIMAEKYSHRDVKADLAVDLDQKEVIYSEYEKHSTVTLTIQIQRKVREAKRRTSCS